MHSFVGLDIIIIIISFHVSIQTDSHQHHRRRAERETERQRESGGGWSPLSSEILYRVCIKIAGVLFSLRPRFGVDTQTQNISCEWWTLFESLRSWRSFGRGRGHQIVARIAQSSGRGSDIVMRRSPGSRRAITARRFRRGFPIHHGDLASFTRGLARGFAAGSHGHGSFGAHGWSEIVAVMALLLL